MFDDRLRAALRRITTPLPLLALGSWTQVLAFAQVLPVNPSPPAASHQELRVRGRVVDALGGAVAAADVWLADEDGREIGRTRCDGLGVFFFDEPAASARSVHATAPGTIVACVDLGPENRSVAIELRLWDAATLRGRVLDDAGAPIAGAH